MKNLALPMLLLAASISFYSCEKDTTGDGLTCADLTDDVVIIDGKAFEFHTSGAYGCGEGNINGGTHLIHFRDMIYGSGNTLIIPVMNIALSSVPPLGATTTYQLDNGMPWQISAPAVVGRAALRIYNHEETPELQENWFSDSESGTIAVTSDSNGNVTYNFSVQLVKNGGQLTDRKTVCGQNIVCRSF